MSGSVGPSLCVMLCHAQEVTAAREPVQGLDPGVDGEMAQDAATPCVLIRAGSACCAVLEYPAVHLLYTALQSEGTIVSDSPVYLSSQLRALTQVS
jgi:hypothetical protein